MSLAGFDLTGLGIGVTGGGGHLGSAVARGLADAGATVVVAGRTAETLERTVAGGTGRGRLVAEVADMARAEDVERVLDHIVREAGGVHGWVHCAYDGTRERLSELTRDGTTAALSSALTDLMLATDTVAKRLSSGGSIVHIASMYGLVSPRPEVYRDHPQFHNPPAYGAAKAGVIQFTRYAACHLATRNIRVNCITPGPFPSGEPAADPGFVAALERQIPLGRVGRPEELVGAAIFLLGSASSYVTGHNLVVDGGWTAW